MAPTLAVLGAGNMGTAVMAALLKGGAFSPDRVRVTTRRKETGQRLVDRYGVEATSNVKAVRGADVILIAVKPDQVVPVLDEVADHVREGAIIMCLAAGVSLDTLEDHAPEGAAVFRVMPNTPALVQEGVLIVSPGKEVGDKESARAQELLAHCGKVVLLAERYQDAATGVSGCGPAYVFALAEAMIEGGVVQGLTREVATDLTVQTLYGAAALLKQTGRHPALLREQVTSPGGATAAGLRVLDSRGLRSATVDAIEAAVRRSRELGG